MNTTSIRAIASIALMAGITACASTTEETSPGTTTAPSPSVSDTSRGTVTTTDTAKVSISAAAADTARAADTSTATGTVTTGVPSTGQVSLKVNAQPGQQAYLTDASGRALYYIASGEGLAVAECTGECATMFEPVLGTAVLATGETTAQAGLIGQVTLPNGTKQVTYQGKPLYYHKGEAAGTTTGKGMTAGSGQATLVMPRP